MEKYWEGIRERKRKEKKKQTERKQRTRRSRERNTTIVFFFSKPGMFTAFLSSYSMRWCMLVCKKWKEYIRKPAPEITSCNTLFFSFVSFSHYKKGDKQCEGNLITFALFMQYYACMGKGGAGHWHGPVTRLGWLGPAQPQGPGWAQPVKKNYFQKIYEFLQIFLLYFSQYQFVFLYCKDTNSVLKYPVFNKKKIYIFCFHAYDKVSQK